MKKAICVLNLIFLITSTAWAQDKITVEGKVIDSEEEIPLPGAEVVEKGTQNGTTTNFDGEFELEVAEDAVLVISSLGFATSEVEVEGKTEINITLKSESSALDEVVLVGYGTQKKANLTGAVSSLDMSDVQNRAQSNLGAALQGVAPGVTVINRSGSDPEINIRGRGNLGTSAPLYVIDGAISDASTFNNLDPNSIESVSFLKDAASSAIYGSRAAYGVVEVKTKEGKEGKMQISYDGYYGFKTPTYLPKVVSSYEYAELENEARYNVNPANGNHQAYSAEEIEKFKNGSDPDYYPNTDWFSLALQEKVPTTKHALSFNGGGGKVNYFSSLGFNQEQGFKHGDHNRRFNFLTNVNAEIKKWLSIKNNISYIRNEGEMKHGAPDFGSFLIVPATMVGQHSNGEWGSIAGGDQATQEFMNRNPLRAYSRGDWSKSLVERTMYNFSAIAKPIEGLTLNGQIVMNKTEVRNKSYSALQDNIISFESGNEISGTGNSTNSMSMNWNSNLRMQYIGTAEYQKEIDKHDFKILAGTTFEHLKTEGLSASRRNFPSDNLEDIEGGSSSGKDISNEGGIQENKILSYFGRVNYSFDDKYLLEANFRADATSSFYKDSRWGYFPSFSAGWRMNEEDFLKDVDWISELKIRGSWGELGNTNNVGYYDYFQTFQRFPAYVFNGNSVSGLREARAANRSLTWEKETMTDVGVDLSLFRNKLNLTVDYYYKKTTDILLPYNVPVEVGLAVNPSQNVGEVENKGVELNINYQDQIDDFKYDVSFNMSANSNKILDMGDSDNMILNGGDKIRYINKVGGSVGDFYGYQTDGLYSQEEIDAGKYYILGRKPNAGDIKYVPQREDVEYGEDITGEDRTVIGNDVPKLNYGLNVYLEYKDVYLNIFGQGVQGTSVAFESEQVWPFFTNASPREMHLGRWSEDNPNPNAVYPRIYGGSSNDDYNQNFSDFELFNADYFRIKTLTLGYNLPENLTAPLELSNASIFITGENLFTIRGDKRMKDFDPEAPTGRGLGAYSEKSLVLGLTLNF